MNKRDYYIRCMHSGAYAKKEWVISAFAVVSNRPQLSEVTFPYQIIYSPEDKDKLYFANPIEDGYEAIQIEDSDSEKPLYIANETLDITAGELPLEHESVNTTYGIILGNMYILYYPFLNKFKFHNGEISPNFEKTIVELLTDNVADPSQESPSRIYVREYIKYGEACDMLADLDKLFVFSGSNKLLTVADSVIQLRDSLIEQYKDQLSDPRIQAMIEDQVVKADKASFVGDPAEKFLVSGKSFNPTRKKQLIMIGGSAGFGGADGGSASFIPTSLRDGWNVEDIPIHANEARAGSYFRGKETALGGTEVINATRMTMNTKLVDEFCKTTKGIPITITEEDKSKYVGLNIVGKQGPIPLDKDNINQYVGKSVLMHSPQYCLSPGDSYCTTCIGKNWSLLKNGLSSAVSNIGDVLTNDKMKRMHGKAMKLTVFYFTKSIF